MRYKYIICIYLLFFFGTMLNHLNTNIAQNVSIFFLLLMIPDKKNKICFCVCVCVFFFFQQRWLSRNDITRRSLKKKKKKQKKIVRFFFFLNWNKKKKFKKKQIGCVCVCLSICVCKAFSKKNRTHNPRKRRCNFGQNLVKMD